MAEENGGNGKDFTSKDLDKCGSEGSDSCDDNDEPSLGLDIGLGDRNHGRNRNPPKEGNPTPGTSSESIRREENAFSLKHFLSRESHGGARPKVYPTLHTSTPFISASEATSALPDFVQDHLVIEQSYLNSPQIQHNSSAHIESRPDFPGRFPEDEYRGCEDLGFDLTGRPPDLGQQQEVGTSKSLPDFLSDGPIRNERAQPTTSPPLSPERRPPSLQIENERLRRELDVLRRQLSDQIVRSETLDTELSLLRERDRSGLENLIEQLEDNVRRTRRRADEAESRASKLKVENNALRCELERISSGPSGSGGASCSGQETDSQRLASQLRNAANNAELSLRHLLIGVDNLRLLAVSLESQPQVPMGRRQSLSDDSQDDESGPAL